ncbi:hypothetical protein [Blastopirellula marina]|nr:hypothetical protein [Blastopirellula marina]
MKYNVPPEQQQLCEKITEVGPLTATCSQLGTPVRRYFVGLVRTLRSYSPKIFFRDRMTAHNSLQLIAGKEIAATFFSVETWRSTEDFVDKNRKTTHSRPAG